tara:strand:+ start:100 stop:357 length:258 start_codon:yes stop_codon:yes gene_type:complete
MNSVINKYGEELFEIELKKLPSSKSTNYGERFFRRNPDTLITYVKGDFTRSDGYERINKYSCINFETNNEILLKGSTKVFIGFTF